jgi:hypothetical protein
VSAGYSLDALLESEASKPEAANPSPVDEKEIEEQLPVTNPGE